MKTIVLENDKIKAVLLPELGGKTASFFFKPQKFELAAANERGDYIHPKKSTAFEVCDASGWDDTFPTILPGKLHGNAAAFSYTDHGEIWRNAMETNWEGDTLHMQYESRENPFCYEKRVQLLPQGLLYSYTIENTGEEEFPCMWTMHGLTRYEPDMEFFYPAEVNQFLNVADSHELGAAGTLHQAEGGYDFHHVPSKSTITQLKYYAAGMVRTGCCGYRFPSQQVACTIRYDASVLPYLGMWITAGGFRGDYNCAWEPSSGYYDGVEIAAKNDTLWMLKAHAKKEFCIAVEMERAIRFDLVPSKLRVENVRLGR